MVVNKIIMNSDQEINITGGFLYEATRESKKSGLEMKKCKKERVQFCIQDMVNNKHNNTVGQSTTTPTTQLKRVRQFAMVCCGNTGLNAVGSGRGLFVHH